MPVELSRMRTLRELAIRKTMAAVSDALHLTPSAISQQVTSLSRELGVELIQRRGRGVQLTPAGSIVVRYAEQITSLYEAAKADLMQLSESVAGEVRVASFSSAAATLIPPVIRQLRDTYPSLRTTVDEMEADEGIDALRLWEIDVVLVHDLTTGEPLPPDVFKAIPIHEDELCCLMAAGHVLSREEEVSISDLRNECWVMDSSPYYSNYLVECCHKAGFLPAIIGRTNSSDVIMALVENGCAVSVLPSLVGSTIRANVVTKPIRPQVKRKISAVIRKADASNPAVAAVVEGLLAIGKR